MTIKEAYTSFGGDYEGTISRLGNEDFLKRLLTKFLDDSNIRVLLDSYNKGECESAFRAVHTLKGLCLNLGLTSLATSCVALTEKLRGGSMDGSKSLLDDVMSDYGKTVQLLKECL